MSVHLIDPWEQFTGPEPIRPRLRGNDYCNPGEPSDPGESCSWHPEHYYCEVCLGWYGASHDGTHGGTGYGWPHPGSRPDQCACRPCRVYTEWCNLPSDAARRKALRTHTAAVRAVSS